MGGNSTGSSLTRSMTSSRRPGQTMLTARWCALPSQCLRRLAEQHGWLVVTGRRFWERLKPFCLMKSRDSPEEWLDWYHHCDMTQEGRLAYEWDDFLFHLQKTRELVARDTVNYWLPQLPPGIMKDPVQVPGLQS